VKAVSGKALCKVVEQNGWELKRITGSHHIYSKTGVDIILIIPVHSSRDWEHVTLFRRKIKTVGWDVTVQRVKGQE
jgi:predicted RNA binding protein YcfA (HicA-like mRNA interferase family)